MSGMNSNLPECDVETFLKLVGGKWKVVVLYRLIDSPKRFNELQRTITKITQRMLTLQLRELESDGLVHREVYPVVPPKVEYSLTDLGQTLEPLLRKVADWGSLYKELS